MGSYTKTLILYSAEPQGKLLLDLKARCHEAREAIASIVIWYRSKDYFDSRIH